MASLCASILRSRWTPVLFLAGLAVLAALPPGGLGLPVCGFKVLTRLPCPGCGLTRSLIRLADGDVAGSLALHPAGIVVFAAAAVFALLSLLPQAPRERLAGWVEGRERAANAGGLVLLGMILVYGLGRIAALLGGHGRSIW